MAIVLAEETRTAKTAKFGNDTFSLTAGKVLKIETSPDGEEVLNETVPSGKTWSVTVSVYIREVDA